MVQGNDLKWILMTFEAFGSHTTQTLSITLVEHLCAAV